MTQLARVALTLYESRQKHTPELNCFLSGILKEVTTATPFSTSSYPSPTPAPPQIFCPTFLRRHKHLSYTW